MSAAHFGMAIARRPTSANRTNTRYQARITEEARRRWDDGPLAGPLYVRVVWFHRKATSQDVDNILKPIIDGLEGVVFEDDLLVQRCASVRVDVGREAPVFDEEAAQSPGFDDLLMLLARREDHVLYVEVGALLDPGRATLGAVR